MVDTIGTTDSRDLSHVYPGRGLGWISLGASIHGVVSRLKAQPQLYQQIHLSYSPEEPIFGPIIVELPKNDIRLRFDGPDQRLRLIEIMGWSQTTFLYKNTEVVRRHIQPDKSSEPRPPTSDSQVSGPSFRHIYNRLFGPAYAGEYLPPATNGNVGTYVLSYPGLAVRFPLKHSSYSDRADFVSLLSSAASPATSIAIFSGASWPEARDNLYTKPPPLPRSLALAGKNADTAPDEIENVIIHTRGKLELIRRSTAPFTIYLSETTPQDLVAELGPPDAIFKKPSSRISIHAASSSRQPVDTSPPFHPSSVGTNHSSNNSLASAMEDDSDLDNHNQSDTDTSPANPDLFYNYFHHGFDILISHPTSKSPTLPGLDDRDHASTQAPAGSNLGNQLTATKVFLHGNVPGSYSFNRHRRSRWIIPLPRDFTPPDPTPSPSAPIPDLDRRDAPRSATSLSQLQAKSKSGKAGNNNNLNSTSKSDNISTKHSNAPPASQSQPYSVRRHDTYSINAEVQLRSATSRAVTRSSAAHQEPHSESHVLDSEMRFPEISRTLNALWSGSTLSATGINHYPSQGMVLNRGWTADLSSPESSVELLGGTMTMDDHYSLDAAGNFGTTATKRAVTANAVGMAGIDGDTGIRRGGGAGGTGGNTQLFGFPGMLFEVLDHGEISCISIY